MKKAPLFVSVVVAIVMNVAGQAQLKYSPVSGLSQTDIQTFLDQNKNSGITISADANTESEYEYDYGLLILSKDKKAIAVFNYGCQSYVMVVHNLPSPINNSQLYAYGQVLFPETFGGQGHNLTLKELENKFGASIFPLTKKIMAGCIMMLTD